MHQAGELELGIGTNAFAIEAIKHGSRCRPVKALAVVKHPDFQSALSFAHLSFGNSKATRNDTWQTLLSSEPHGSESRETKVQLLVDGVLLGWFFQLNRDFQVWLIHHVVGPEGAVPACNHLNAPRAVSNAGGAGLAIVVGLQLQALLLLPAVLVHRMQNNFGVFYWLAVRVFEHGEIENRRRRLG